MAYGNWPFRIVLIIVVFVFQSFCVDNESDKQERIKFREEGWRLLCKEASEKERMLFVYVGADYCSTCHKMEASFRSPKLGNLYNKKFISIRFDAKDIIQHQRATAWGVTSVPTLVYLDEDRDVVHMVSGYRDTDGLLKEAETALMKAGKESVIVEETK